MNFLQIIFCFLIACLIGSCSYSVGHKSFVASSFEPLVINKKGAIQGAFGMRPIKYGYADFTYAPSNHIALRLNSGGTLGLVNLSSSVLYFNGLNKLRFFGGGLFNFQSNQIHRELGNLSGTYFKNYDYDCTYYSPGMVVGVSYMNGEFGSHHLIVKSQYNLVESYGYKYQTYDRYTYFTNEQLNYKIPNFFSFEFSYSYLIPMENQKGHIKLQIGGLVTQKTLQNHYVYNKIAPYTGGEHYGSGTNFHPVSFPINISFGFIFSSRKD